MKKVFLAVLFSLTINFTITSCEPDNLVDQEYEAQSSDKEGAGTIGDKGGEDEDHN